MQPIQNAVLSIAGFDPSGGAGILADIKTFEQTGVYGCGISTCITFQNDLTFKGIKWLNFKDIESQFSPLASRLKFGFVKIGMVRDSDMLRNIIDMLKKHNPEVKIIWDPVLKTSTGFKIHDSHLASEILPLIKDIYLLTPNLEEAEALKINPLESLYNILVTSGFVDDKESIDILNSRGDIIKISAPKLENAEKHGSGCVLSAAITAYLSKGLTLENACQKAKDYTYRFLAGTQSLLGFHHFININ
jgi:hydroxymethylpyrimidine/phosphomethylpyrimidine kinase